MKSFWDVEVFPSLGTFLFGDKNTKLQQISPVGLCCSDMSSSSSLSSNVPSRLNVKTEKQTVYDFFIALFPTQFINWAVTYDFSVTVGFAAISHQLVIQIPLYLFINLTKKISSAGMLGGILICTDPYNNSSIWPLPDLNCNYCVCLTLKSKTLTWPLKCEA